MNKIDIINSIFYPRKSFLKADIKDMKIAVSNEVQVGIRLFLVDENWPTILYFHGNAELAQEYNQIAKFYNEQDINFVVSDYRGYGLSTGLPNIENLHSDAVKIFDYILSYLKNNNYSNRIVIMGRSLGSASACEIISKREKNIDKCIIESGFATEYPLLDLMNITPESIDYSIDDGFQNLSKLKKYKKPILFIHADMDNIIPINEAELMLKESGSKSKELLVATEANHNNIIMVLGDKYFKKISKFISTI